MDPGTILGFSTGYLTALVGIFLLYLPYLVLLVTLLIAAGILQLLLLPFAILIRKLRRTKPRPIPDNSWILNPTNSQPPERILLLGRTAPQ
ncbi:hypothetical protein LFT44_21480 (plasmid) [Arthrobacter sp. FW306-05-C]|uniref:hypothetical protein n=1 Tax=Arthrobacter sp. FW306-05-C TaxID=2879620 RepID=UPI001F2500D5|nr:hypothetical protein [Arthrobacter sp. FW306-05-C]UKA69095.1 hypothetical protein LFT44_21480 [Arthrobacter sp. FW306-05-C]